MTKGTDGRAQGQATGSGLSSLVREIPADFLDVSLDRVRRMTGGVIEATDGLDRIIERVESALRDARALAELHAPFSEEMLVSVHAISLAVESMAKQVEQVSSASAVLSLQSMADMAHDLQKHITQIAVAQSG